MVIFIGHLKFFSTHSTHNSLHIQFSLFYHQLQNMVKHILYQILIHQHIIPNDKEFFLIAP